MLQKRAWIFYSSKFNYGTSIKYNTHWNNTTSFRKKDKLVKTNQSHIDNSGQSKEITITPITAHQLNVHNGKKTIKAPKERMCYVNKSKVMEQDKENNKNKTQHCT